MEGGGLSRLVKDTPASRRQAMQALESSPKFREYSQKLGQHGFSQEHVSFSPGQNSTGIRLEYRGPANETASITAEVSNNTVERVELVMEEQQDRLRIHEAAVVAAGCLGYCSCSWISCLPGTFREKRAEARAYCSPCSHQT